MRTNTLHNLLPFMLLFTSMIYAFTKQQANDAEKGLFKIKKWKELFEAIEKYPCDDGAIAEGFSQAVSNCVRMNASALNKLKLSKKQWDFIVKHTDESWSQYESEEAISLLKYSQPKDGSYAWTIVTKLRRFKEDMMRKEMEMQKLIRCNMDILKKVSKSIENLDKALVDSFFNNFGVECGNNTEFGEWSN